MEGVIVTKLSQISVDGGDVLHGIKSSDPTFFSFGEAYFSLIKKGAIKGWKKHLTMNMNIIVPQGRIKFVIFDDRVGSSTYLEFFSIELSRDNYCRLTVPAGLWMAFCGVGTNDNLLMNFADIEHNPKESIHKSLVEISYDWSIYD